jgi:hypothetical protein
LHGTTGMGAALNEADGVAVVVGTDCGTVGLEPEPSEHAATTTTPTVHAYLPAQVIGPNVLDSKS